MKTENMKRGKRAIKVCNLQYGAFLLPFSSSNTHSFPVFFAQEQNKIVHYLLVFVIGENEILISVIPESLFFSPVNCARDPSCTTLM